MKNFIVLLLSLGTCLSTFGQTKELVYLNTQDSTSNYYLAFKPAAQPKGLLLLLTSFGESPEIAANETDIQIAATKAGLLAVFASLQHGTQSFFIDSLSQSTLKEFILEIQHQYKLTDKPFYLGGFSLGGSGAIKYAESAYSLTGLPKPKAIFAIDPPLDFERMYYSLEYAIRNSHVEIAKREADYFIKRLQYEFQSIPQQNNKAYQILSPYSFTDSTQAAIQKLKTCPILLASEPDIIWQMEERNRSLYDLNTLDCSLVINTLRQFGNKQAKLVLTSGKGFRKLSGKRNPHSWSILNSEETIQWLLGQ